MNSETGLTALVQNKLQIDSTKPVFDIKDIPLGTCLRCKKRQTTVGFGGLFINGESENWACDDCRCGLNGPEIKSYSGFNCEHCTYSDIEHGQGGTASCPRCDFLEIGDYTFKKDLKNAQMKVFISLINCINTIKNDINEN